MVGGAHQRGGLHPTEADRATVLAQFLELFQVVIAGNRQVLLGRLQVLADRQDIHAPAALVAHDGLDFLQFLAQPDHDTGFCQDLRVEFFGVAQDGRAPLVMILGLNLLEQPWHGLHVVVQNFRAGLHDDFQSFQRAFEIRDEHFHRAARQELADAPDHHGKDRRAAIPAVIPVDGGDDGMFQLHGFDRLGHAFRLQPIERIGAAMFNVTETAGARAHISQHKEGGGAGAPALAHIRAHGFFADGVQRFGAHQRLQVFIGFAGRSAYLDPIRPSQRGGRDTIRVDDPVTGGGTIHKILLCIKSF